MADAFIVNLRDSTSVDRDTGAVRSVQAADLLLSEDALRELWSAEHLERLARTYWRFLTRVTLGVVRVHYTEGERFVVLLLAPLRLLTFDAPEYEFGGDHGVVRWRIKGGLLVARGGRDGGGHLQIEVHRSANGIRGLGGDPGPRGAPGPDGKRNSEGDPGPERDPGPDGDHSPGQGRGRPRGAGPCARLHVEVEVANFHPAIAFRLGRGIYNATQSRIHVLVTRAFLRSLARLDLAQSRVGRFQRSDDGARTTALSRSGRRRRGRAAWHDRGGR